MDYGTYIIESEAFKLLDKHEVDRNITYILEPRNKEYIRLKRLNSKDERI